jgi:hypothetical protein
MRSLIAMLGFSCVAYAASCAGDDARHAPVPHAPAPHAPAAAAAPVAVAPRVAVAADPREATRRGAHDALAEHCGECHESHRPTAKAPALAIFDLDQPDWPSRFDEHRYESALTRLTKKSAAARDAFIAFRDAERRGPVVTLP